MKINENDWRVTAYALGELDGDDLAAVEAAVGESAELRAVVEGVRVTAGLISDELGGEGGASLGLSDEQRGRVLAAAERGEVDGLRGSSARSGVLGRIGIWSGAVAACLVVGWYFFVPNLMNSGATSSQSIAVVREYKERLAMNTPTERDGVFANVKGDLIVGRTDATDNSTALHDRRTSGRKLAKRQRAPAPGGGIVSDDGFDSTTVAMTQSGPAGREITRDLRFSDYGGAASAKQSNGDVLAGDRVLETLVSLSRHPPGFGETAPAIDLQNTQNQSSGKNQRRGRRGKEQLHSRAKTMSEPSFDGNDLVGGNLEGWQKVLRDVKGKDIKRFAEATRACDEFATQPGDGLMRCIKSKLYESAGVETYASVLENPFVLAVGSPLSTFSIDVDTASYSNVRRFLNRGVLPPVDAVRIEELVNYFDYDYPLPAGEHPFSVDVAVADCPWDERHRLARIGIKGMELTPDERPAANLVFLIDVSGSMGTANKLPLLTESLSMLVDELGGDDWVSMVVYAGASGLALPSTSCGNKDSIRSALQRLQAGGSTNGGAGIELAYQVAEDNFIEGGVNRVILATDGDFNVGTTGQGGLTRLIEEKAKGGVFLSVLGFGMGNLKDATLETLADKGNGNYAYIDTDSEAQKVLVDQLTGTLITIAKDVKIQVEFNPAEVAAYRLIGYENRMLAARDFNDDKKDAGEIGAGHTVTAFYEIIPVGEDVELPSVDSLKYQAVASGEETEASSSGEMMTVKLRYKFPDEDESTLIEIPFVDDGGTFADSSDDFAFASAVASFGMLLRNSASCGELTFADVIEIGEGAVGSDRFGYRAEFLELVRKAEAVSGNDE